MTTKIQVIFYCSHGHIFKMAEAMIAGAREIPDVEATLWQVPELMPDNALKSHARAARASFAQIPTTKPELLAEADAIIFVTPTRLGNMCAQMHNFIDQTGGRIRGALNGKGNSVFCNSASQHSSPESTMLNFHTTRLRNGMVIVGVPYSVQQQMIFSEITSASPNRANPITNRDGAEEHPSEKEIATARFQGRHIAEVTGRLKIAA
ncbi:MAG: NAD(P)H:quinone oxidoreductase [Candidatus Nitrotoga sp.]